MRKLLMYTFFLVPTLCVRMPISGYVYYAVRGFSLAKSEAVAYAEWLSQNTGKKYRLPTEAEWEYAARGGTRDRSYWGNNKDDACKYANVADRSAKSQWSDWTTHNCDDGYKVTAPVGKFQPNAFGLYDMMGNVWEWVQDTYSSDAYKQHSRNNPIYTGSGSYRVFRGGSWHHFPQHFRASNRVNNTPVNRNNNIGFRLAGHIK